MTRRATAAAPPAAGAPSCSRWRRRRSPRLQARRVDGGVLAVGRAVVITVAPTGSFISKSAVTPGASAAAGAALDAGNGSPGEEGDDHSDTESGTPDSHQVPPLAGLLENWPRKRARRHGSRRSLDPILCPEAGGEGSVSVFPANSVKGGCHRRGPTSAPALRATTTSGASIRAPPREDHHMATDYDASRKTEDEQKEESLEARRLTSGEQDKTSGKVDEDETELAETYELPGADLSHEILSIEVTPGRPTSSPAQDASSFSTNPDGPHRASTSVPTAPEETAPEDRGVSVASAPRTSPASRSAAAWPRPPSG